MGEIRVWAWSMSRDAVGGYKEGPQNGMPMVGQMHTNLVGPAGFSWQLTRLAPLKAFEACDGCIGNLPFSRINHRFYDHGGRVQSCQLYTVSFGLEFYLQPMPSIDVGSVYLPRVD